MRILTCLIIILLGFVHNIVVAQELPALPNTSSIETCYPDTTGYQTITVGPIGRDYSDLQLAINAAPNNTILLLDAGAIFKGGFTLPEKSGEGWVIIQSAQQTLLPKQAERIDPNAPTGTMAFPLQKDAMPKIITTNKSGIPCFKTVGIAHHYRFVGLEISVDTNVTTSYGLMFLGDGSVAQNTFDKVPHDFIIDRCYIHGHENASILKAGVLLNCSNSAIIDSYIDDFHSIGYDTYAIGGTNGPGPFIIRNNYLSAAGENILFGGAAPAIAGLVPSDIEVIGNTMYKPFKWKLGHPDYAGKHWTIKNLLEFKTGKRVLVQGNIMENTWADLPIGQSGYAILLTVRSEGGASPQADVSDVSIIDNFIRHAGAGITISGHDSPPAQSSKRILIANNLFDDINGATYGDGNTAGPNDGIFVKLGDPNDVIIEHNTVFQTGAITWVYDTIFNMRIQNNIFNCSLSAGGYQGIYGPGFAQGGNGPMATFLPGITDANQLFHKNILIGGNSAKYSNYNTTSNNYFPKDNTQIGFTDFNNGINDFNNYALLPTSQYKNAGSDGKDIGVNYIALEMSLNEKYSCITTQITQEKNNTSSSFRIFPTVFQDNFTIVFKHEIKNAQLRILDITGTEVYNQQGIFGSSIEIRTKEIQAGFYFVQVIQESKILGIGKLVKL